MVCHVLRIGETVVGSIVLGLYRDEVGRAYGHVRWSEIDARYRGLGLGRKLYGEAMRRHSYLSSRGASPSASRVWESFARRPSGISSTEVDADGDRWGWLPPGVPRVQVVLSMPLPGRPVVGHPLGYEPECDMVRRAA